MSSRPSAKDSQSLATRFAEKASFLEGPAKYTPRYIPPLHSANDLFGGKVAQMVTRMERTVVETKKKKKPPLAEQESLEEEKKAAKPRRKYMGHLTSTNFLHNIFSSNRKEPERKTSREERARVVALSGAAAGDPMVLRAQGAKSAPNGVKLRRTATDIWPLGGRLKKRQSEGEVLTNDTAGRKNKRLSMQIGETRSPPLPALMNTAGQGVSPKVESRGRPRSALVDVSAKENIRLEKEGEIALRPLEPRKNDRAFASLMLQRKVCPAAETESGPARKGGIGPAANNERRPVSCIGMGGLRSNRLRTPGSVRPLSRTMTQVESNILPPLYENVGPEEETPDKGAGRKARRYVGSHTTSTYQGQKDTAPDATPRRHLIGFLHRTSHLSLTSELSGNASFYLIGHRGRRFEDSTIGSESDARMFSDDDDRGSTTTDITSVSRQHENMYRKRRSRRQYRRPSRASSFSSITESSMSLDVITVTLNMDTVNFLGISIVGQSSARGDNGIYVANIMKGGAVALDGRIEAGDMILQVNDISFENFTNDQAVDVLRDAVARKGPIKLTVAKCFENGPKNCFTIPRNHRDEPVRPIDTQAWIQHTNAMRGMPSILEGSEGAPTPVPSDWGGRPPSSSTVTSGSNGPNTIVNGQHKLNVHSDKKKIVEVMSMPSSGLDIKDRTWLKIPIPMSFLGSDLVDWLLEHVDGLRERKDARRFAGELLKMKLIAHVVNQITFIEQRYYVLGDECADFARYRMHPDDPAAGRWKMPSGPAHSTGHAHLTSGHAPHLKGQQATSMVSGYASMPVSPFPQHYIPNRGGADGRSQASGGSGEGSGSGSDHRRRQVVLPPAPSQAPPPRLEDQMSQEMAASRQSFRMAMNQPYEFFVDNL